MSLTPTEFTKDGVRYRMRALNVIEQLHLNRKIAPLLPPLIPVLMKLVRDRAAEGEENAFNLDVEGLAALALPFANSIADMSNEKAEEIITMCLGTISRYIEQGNAWMPVWIANAKASTYPEFNSLHTALPFVLEVINNALGPFIQGFLSKADTKEPEMKTTL